MSNVVAVAFDRPGLRMEFDRQVQHLIDLGYPALVGLTGSAFRAALRPLRRSLPSVPAESTVREPDLIDFLVVVSVVPITAAASRMTLRSNPAKLMLEPEDAERFTPTDAVSLPSGLGYLLVEIDTGTEFTNVPPADALPVITARGRTGLTIAEGVALVTLRPDMLRKNKCFSLLASRCGDKRVPAIWISAGAPKLGWCWDGNPHTWLGSASAGSRIGL